MAIGEESAGPPTCGIRAGRSGRNPARPFSHGVYARSPRSHKGTLDNQIMDTNDVHFLRHRAHGGDNIGRPRSFSLIAGSFRTAIEAALAAVRGWFRGLAESTHLGPVPEQVIGRKTGART